jgi:hypothetical protein
MMAMSAEVEANVYLGTAAMALGLGLMQVVRDEGPQTCSMYVI